MSIRSLHLIIFLSIFFLLTNCKSFTPVGPTENYSNYIFKPELSEVIVPVEIPLQSIEKTINQKFTGLLYEDSDLHDNNDDNLMLKVWKQDTISIEMAGDHIQYKVPLKIWIKAGWKLEKFGIGASDFKETECAIILKFITKISVDSKWNVITKTSGNGYEWIYAPTLKIGIFDFSMKFIADRILNTRQQEFAKMIDDQAREYLLIKPYIEDLWKLMQNPLSISSNPSMWLKVIPHELLMTHLTAQNGKIMSSIGVKAFAETIVGDKPEVNINPTLPDLKLVTKTENHFAVSLSADISFQHAEKLAEQMLKGQVYFFKDGKYKIKVEDIDLYGSGNKLIVKMGLSEDIEGNIYLKGVPYYDSTTSTLKVKELDYDIETKNKILKSANWLAHGSFLKRIEPYLQYSLIETINSTKKIIEQNLTNNKVTKNIVLNGKLLYFSPREIILTPTGLKAIIQAKGKLNLLIDGLE